MKDHLNDHLFNGRELQDSLGFALRIQKAIGSRSEMTWALEDLKNLIHAQSVMHVRRRRGSPRAVSAARYEPTEGMLFSAPMRSYINVVLGEHLHTANSGTVWLLSDADPDDFVCAELSEFNIKDIAIVPLENSERHSDYLEVHFSRDVPEHDRVLMQVIGPSIVEAWQLRSPGSVADMMRGRPARVASAERQTGVAAILSPENPAELTRAEFRICAMIHEGQLPKSIAECLAVKESTLRSHLRSIYLKTGVSGQVELVHRLNGVAVAERAS